MTTLAARTVGHTPIPWDVQNKGVLGERSARHEVVAGVSVDGSKNLPKICKMPDLSKRSYTNAAFIVLACNAHDDLLAALKDLLGNQPDMVREDEHTVSCRHCGRGYTAKKAPVDATGCSDDCPGYLARAAIAKTDV